MVRIRILAVFAFAVFALAARAEEKGAHTPGSVILITQGLSYGCAGFPDRSGPGQPMHAAVVELVAVARGAPFRCDPPAAAAALARVSEIDPEVLTAQERIVAQNRNGFGDFHDVPAAESVALEANRRAALFEVARRNFAPRRIGL